MRYRIAGVKVFSTEGPMNVLTDRNSFLYFITFIPWKRTIGSLRPGIFCCQAKNSTALFEQGAVLYDIYRWSIVRRFR
jgi:hypothetical protein